MAVVSTLFVKGISAFSAVREQLLSEQIIAGEDNGQLASFTLSDFSVNCAFGGALLILWGVQAIVRIKSWQGPADIIFASHDAHARIEAKQGIFSAFASFVSLSAGASLGQYGPIVHLGGLVGHLAKRLRLVSHLGGDVWLGCAWLRQFPRRFMRLLLGFYLPMKLFCVISQRRPQHQYLLPRYLQRQYLSG